MSKFSIAYGMKRKADKGHQSSCTSDCNSPCAVHEQASGYEDHDVVSRVIKQRMKKNSDADEGATNETDPNEFDYMEQTDTPEFNYTESNSGDDRGDAQLDEDDRDIVARVMRSRRKGGRMPSPK